MLEYELAVTVSDVKQVQGPLMLQYADLGILKNHIGNDAVTVMCLI